jgi:hypothetical protein
VFTAVFCLILGGCAPSAEQKQAMEGVLKQRLEAKALFGSPRNPAQFETNSLAFVQALKAINTSRCPADFREAWSDYVVIVQRSSSRFLSLVATNTTMAGGAHAPAGATNPPASPTPAPPPPAGGNSNKAEHIAELERRIQVFQKDIDVAWKALQQVSQRHGIKPER